LKAARALAIVGLCALGLSCNTADNAQRGSDREEQLVVATAAGDEGKVREILAAGGDPNKTASFDGHYQSAWKFALNNARIERARCPREKANAACCQARWGPQAFTSKDGVALVLERSRSRSCPEPEGGAAQGDRSRVPPTDARSLVRLPSVGQAS
jgi:hypothetical protein